MPHYQPPLVTEKSPTTSPYSSFDATSNYTNNNSQPQQQQQQQYTPAPPTMVQQSNIINNNPKYQQQTQNYNTNGNVQPVRNNYAHGAVNSGTAGGGISNNQQMQQQLQQKYYDQYENYARPNGNPNNNQNGMSQSSYNNTKAYGGHPQNQMTSSYNQQLSYNNLYNHQNGSSVGKISDYDPMTEGPRNIPQSPGRSNQTLIYSSDRAASKYTHILTTLSSYQI